MLDLRLDQNKSSTNDTRATSGLTPVGSPGPEMEQPGSDSPILRTARKKQISTISPAGRDRTVLYTSLIAIVIAAASGLVAQYFTGNENSRVIKEGERFNQLQTQLSIGETANQLSRIRTVASQLNVFEQATAQATPWPELLAVLEGQVPGAVKLTSVQFLEDENQLVIDGEAGTYTDAANLLKAVEEADRFTDATLSSAQQVETADQTVISFSLTSSYLPKALIQPLDQSTANPATESNLNPSSGVPNGQ